MISLHLSVTKKPELRYSKEGKPYCNLSCVFKPYKKDVPPAERDYRYFKVSVSGQMAEHVAETVQIGDNILASGDFGLADWVGEKGKHEQLEIWVKEIGLSMRFRSYDFVRETSSYVPPVRPVAPVYDEFEEPF